MKNFEFYHGAALTRIIHGNVFDSIKCYSSANSSYVINGAITIYIKYSQKRMSPWSFSFSATHIDEIKEIKNKFNKIYLVFVCGDNGIACLDFKEFSTVISIENTNFPKWIRASRQKGQKFSISGSNGELKHKIGNSDFPEKIYDQRPC
jgi:hypothetical protein